MMRSFVLAALLFCLQACSSGEGPRDAHATATNVAAQTEPANPSSIVTNQHTATANAVAIEPAEKPALTEVEKAAAVVVREPKNLRELRAFCAARRNVPSQGEGGGDFLPFDTPHTWRCKDGRVLVCEMGASGRGCMEEGEVDAERMAAFREWCVERPNENIPYSLSTGLHSTWECRGTRPVMVARGSVDRDGYVRGAWERL